MKYGVVIVTYNRLELLKECLLCIDKQVKKFDSVLIVDNYSTDGTREYLKIKRIDIILFMKNLMEVEQKALKMA